jgi:hypothetical protein
MWWCPSQFQWLPPEITFETACIGWWMGRQGPVSWPNSSPDLSPLDFFLWEHITNLLMLQLWMLQRAAIRPELLWQCKANILNIYCTPNNSCRLLSLDCRTTFLVNCRIIFFNRTLLLFRITGFFGLWPSSCVLKTGEYNVPETVSVSILRWEGRNLFCWVS